MFTVPKVVALSPQQRLLEDDLSIVSLADVFKQVLLLIIHVAQVVILIIFISIVIVGRWNGIH